MELRITAYELHPSWLAWTTRWFDVDGPAIVERKRELLVDASPRCSWQLLVADLSDETARRQAIRTAMQGAQRVLVVTEGLLLYLRPGQVAALATDLASHTACTAWVMDLLSAEGDPAAAPNECWAGRGLPHLAGRLPT
jgi:O-methyltransferase involved in polyketide biosynthesis